MEYRVIVRLTNTTLANECREQMNSIQTTNSASSLCSSKQAAQLNGSEHSVQMFKIINNRTLFLNGVDHSMHFDYVGNENDPRTDIELKKLVDEIFFHNRNCCLIKFKPNRELQSQFLCQMFVLEVEKRLELLHCSLQRIQLEYFEIKKDFVINKFTRSKNQMHISSRKQFNSTRDLLKWLQGDYALLWTTGHSNECLKCEFFYTDSNGQSQSSQFSIIQLYLRDMDVPTKSSLFQYLNNVKAEIRPQSPQMLVNCLSEYFKCEKSWCTWLMFDLPLMSGDKVLMNDILKLANIAYVGMNLIKGKCIGNSLWDSLATQIINPPEEGGSSRKGSNDSALTKSCKNVMCKNLTAFESVKLSNKELNKLSFCYCKIDEKFSKVISTMEAYYEQKYASKIDLICKQTSQVLSNLQSWPHKDLNLIIPKVTTIREFHDEYKSALEAFKQLPEELKFYSKWQMLKIYLKTKSYELKKHGIRCKLRQLNTLQSQLSAIIRDEIQAVKSQGIDQL